MEYDNEEIYGYLRSKFDPKDPEYQKNLEAETQRQNELRMRANQMRSDASDSIFRDEMASAANKFGSLYNSVPKSDNRGSMDLAKQDLASSDKLIASVNDNKFKKESDAALYAYLKDKRDMNRDDMIAQAAGRKQSQEMGLKNRELDLKEKQIAMEQGSQKSQFDKLPIESQVGIKDMASANAKKTSILNQLKSDMEQFRKAKTDDQKVAYGQQMLKTLNSKEGSDAVGSEESKRLGSFLENKMFNFRQPGSMFGRDIDEFATQAEATIDGIAQSIKRNENSIDELSGKPQRNQIADMPRGPMSKGDSGIGISDTAIASPGGKQVVKKQQNKALNKTRFIYSDGSEETVEGLK